MKKYLKYFIIFIFTFLCFNSNVFASVNINYNTKYYVSYEGYDFNQWLIDDSHTVKDYLDSFTGSVNSESDYGLMIFVSNIFNNAVVRYNKIKVVIFPKSQFVNYSSFTAYSQSVQRNFSSITLPNNFTYNTFDLYAWPDSLNTLGSNFLDSSYFINASNCLSGLECNLTFTSGSYGDFNQRLKDNISFTNNSNITFNYSDKDTIYVSSYPNGYESSGDGVLYYSSIPIKLQHEAFNSSRVYYVKSLNLMGVDYELGDIVPTYCEYYDICYGEVSDNTFIDYKSDLGTIYTSFLPSQVDNFKLDISFDTDNITAQDYYQNLGYSWNCFARINNNNNYYSYIQFPYCDFEDTGSFNPSSTNVKLSLTNFAIYDLNDNVISDFSQYDKLFFYLDFDHKDYSLSKIVSNLSIAFNGSSSHYSDNFLGPIYDSFGSLPGNFKMFVSTNKTDYSYFVTKYTSTNNDSLFSIRFQDYNTSDLSNSANPGYITKTFRRLNVNNRSSSGIMIFQLPSSLDEGNFQTLDFVLFPDIVISLRDNSSNDFYYYDNTGTIINSNITIDYNISSDDDYDLSYYLKQVNNFVEDLSGSAIVFSSYTQEFYDSLPFVFQTFIFVIFILFCIYFTFMLIKRK